jgi:hypothetical protein
VLDVQANKDVLDSFREEKASSITGSWLIVRPQEEVLVELVE